MKKIFTLLVLVIGFVAVRAQNGEISGKVTDENGEELPMANVVLIDDKGVFTGRGTSSDFDGNYSLKPLTPGRYNLQVSYTGYATSVQKGVVVYADRPTFINIKMKSATLDEVVITEYKVPLIDPGQTSTGGNVDAKEIATMSSKNITDIAASTGKIVQTDQGKGLNIGGAREEGTQYYVDGVKVTGVPTVPASSIEQLQVITGGVPARYGDLMGGIINITTKGPSSEFHGSAEIQTTQYLDAYGYNLVNANVTGPLWRKKGTKQTILGFFAAFEYLRQQDADPSAVGIWQVRQNVLDSLRQFPLMKKQTESGFNLRADNVSYKDMYKQKVKPNTVETNFRGNGRIDIRPVDNITLAVGGSVVYRKYHEWVEQYTLFNSENNPLHTDLNWRVFGRFTHNIQGKQSDEKGKERKASAFQNAYYTIQVDYEKFIRKYEDESHGFNAFNYGYIGKYKTLRSAVFVRDTFLSPDQNYVLNGWKQVGRQDTAILFTPGDVNPYGTRYTQQYYEMLDAQVNADGSYQVFGQNNTQFTSSLDLIQGNQALINGNRSNFVNNLWYNTGRQYNGYGYGDNNLAKGGNGGDNDQYRVRLEGAFDILKPGAPSRNKHSFEFGVEFEQRIQRSYSVNPIQSGAAPGVWQLARQLVNSHLTEVDRLNPILVIDGVAYENYADPTRPIFTEKDTILFKPLYDAAKQTNFDRQLRKALGWAENSTDLLDIDAVDLSLLNLNLFSPTELLNDGAAIVSYRGYDPYGNRLTSQPSFNDFFTKRNERGEYERPIGAFRPIYTAAYISDRFYFKDLTFNVGLRIDNYNANQKVLTDPYSLYPIKKVADVTQFPNGNSVTHPSNIGSDYYVYVDDKASPQTITGYRKDNIWYDRYGNELASGNDIARASTGNVINPYLENPNANIKDSTFNPNGSFRDYKPRTIVMPRLQFSFNLTDRALFFAHYDILSQRPGSRSIMDPTDYFFFVENGSVNNPDLKPQRTIDFELGFKQRVSQTAAFTISAFYREFRDQIQLVKIYNSYPKDYITYGNIDFGTAKGFSLDFDMRRTANVTLKANYTMQFAEGTGSSDQSQSALVTGNQPNFRTISPLNFDSRHLINVNVSYAFGSGKDYNGPVVKNKEILSNTGISLQFTARSGTPYTAISNSIPSGFNGLEDGGGRVVTKGSINGSRLPWYFRMNMRVWKDFTFVVGKKKEKQEDKRELALQVYLQIQNLLGSKNVVKVYRYTGAPDDNGYLNDPINANTIQSFLNPEAFKDQYSAYVNRPENYSLPRRIYLGVLFSF